MKIKEVSQLTGLTKKTIRFYEDAGLIAPAKEYRNGRDFRDYSEADAARLREIAVLRKARFTIEEIRSLQGGQQDVQEIFGTYYDRIKGEKAELDRLTAVLDAISGRTFETGTELVQAISDVTEEMRLPAVDVHPRFKYIDELEERLGRKEKPMKDKENQEYTPPLTEGMEDSKVFRRLVASTSVDKADNLAVWNNEMNDAFAALKEQESTGVQDREEKSPLWLRIPSAICTLLAIAALVLFFLSGKLLPLVILATLRLLLGYLEYRRKQRLWIERISK